MGSGGAYDPRADLESDVNRAVRKLLDALRAFADPEEIDDAIWSGVADEVMGEVRQERALVVLFGCLGRLQFVLNRIEDMKAGQRQRTMRFWVEELDNQLVLFRARHNGKRKFIDSLRRRSHINQLDANRAGLGISDSRRGTERDDRSEGR
jgi:hypothetical protein